MKAMGSNPASSRPRERPPHPAKRSITVLRARFFWPNSRLHIYRILDLGYHPPEGVSRGHPWASGESWLDGVWSRGPGVRWSAAGGRAAQVNPNRSLLEHVVPRHHAIARLHPEAGDHVDHVIGNRGGLTFLVHGAHDQHVSVQWHRQPVIGVLSV